MSSSIELTFSTGKGLEKFSLLIFGNSGSRIPVFEEGL